MTKFGYVDFDDAAAAGCVGVFVRSAQGETLKIPDFGVPAGGGWLG